MTDIYLCSVPPPGNAGTNDVVLFQTGFQSGMGPTWAQDPNPILPVYRPELKTALGSFPLTLIGLDQFFGAAGQAPQQIDQPNPLIAGRLNNSLGANFFGNTLNVAQAPAIALLDWPNPRIAGRLVEHPIPPNLEIPGEAPFYTTDWQRPIIAGRLAPGEPAPLNLLTNTLGQLAPFALTDWQNPRIAGRLVEVPVASTINTTVGLTQAPFLALDWPNPGIPRRPTLVPDLVNGVIFTAMPFAQTDWPNPLRAGRLADNPIILNLAITEAVFTPALSLDWPNPRLIIPSFIRLEVAPASLPLTTLAPIIPSSNAYVHNMMGSPGG